jgi:hypothetical protein
MKITKLPNKYDEEVHKKEVANEACNKCPFCGETKTSLEYLSEIHKTNSGIQCLPVEIHEEKWLNPKIINKNQYHCYECGAEWESNLYNNQRRDNMKLLRRIKNNLDVPFYVKTKLNYSKKCNDIFGDFEFYLRISKCYTLKGMRWRIEVPNYTGHDTNLYRLLSRTFQYIHDKGCRYMRLEENIDDIDNLWSILETKNKK